jgi:hypothetical protein
VRISCSNPCILAPGSSSPRKLVPVRFGLVTGSQPLGTLHPRSICLGCGCVDPTAPGPSPCNASPPSPPSCTLQPAAVCSLQNRSSIQAHCGVGRRRPILATDLHRNRSRLDVFHATSSTQPNLSPWHLVEHACVSPSRDWQFPCCFCCPTTHDLPAQSPAFGAPRETVDPPLCLSIPASLSRAQQKQGVMRDNARSLGSAARQSPCDTHRRRATIGHR